MSNNRVTRLVGAAAATSLTLGLLVAQSSNANKLPKAGPTNTKLVLEPSALTIGPTAKYRVGYMPTPVTLLDKKPSAITKEPAYKSTPKYGVIHLGNGPKSTYYLAFDEPADGDWKVYVDKNQNGDLTDDGDGSWTKKNTANGRTVYGVNDIVLRASWGNANTETSSGDYGIGLYRIATATTASTFMFREGARIGEMTFAGKSHKVLLVENDSDGVFQKVVETDAAGKPVGKVTGRPLWLLVDLKDDGKFTSDEMFDVRAPFKVADTVYEATIPADGSSITLTPTTKAVAVLTPPRPQPKALLASGTAVPSFRCEAWGGGTIQPSDYKGKVLIVDFWATWCGPCQASMPHLEKVYKSVKDKNVAVLAICVWDEKDAYTKWVPTNQSKYTFPLAFDPAGRNTAESIASKLFNVSGIPTTYVIGPDGKVIDSVVGFSGASDHRLEAALKKAGVDVPVETANNQ